MALFLVAEGKTGGTEFYPLLYLKDIVSKCFCLMARGMENVQGKALGRFSSYPRKFGKTFNEI